MQVQATAPRNGNLREKCRKLTITAATEAEYEQLTRLFRILEKGRLEAMLDTFEEARWRRALLQGP